MSVGTQSLLYPLHSPEICEKFQAFYEKGTTLDVLDDKTRELIVLALASAFRCATCTEKHIEKAFDAGASRKEVAETVLIASVEGAGDDTILGR